MSNTLSLHDALPISRTAMDAFSRMKTPTPARCDAYFENIENPDPAHAGDALQWMTLPRMQCESKYDAVLKSIDARVKGKTVANSFFPSALEHLCDPKGKATPAQITTALGLAHRMAADKTLAGTARASALDASFMCDPKGGKAYLGKFEKETDPDIKNRVTVLKKK